jgi:hypothetical protein
LYYSPRGRAHKGLYYHASPPPPTARWHCLGLCPSPPQHVALRPHLASLTLGGSASLYSLLPILYRGRSRQAPVRNVCVGSSVRSSLRAQYPSISHPQCPSFLPLRAEREGIMLAVMQSCPFNTAGVHHVAGGGVGAAWLCSLCPSRPCIECHRPVESCVIISSSLFTIT